MTRRVSAYLALPLVGWVWMGCGGESGDPFGPPSELAATSSATVTGTVGAAVAEPLRVRVTDMQGRPVPGVFVDFVVTSGGGSVVVSTSGAAAAAVGPRFSGAARVGDSTGAEGEVTAEWTLGPTAGEQIVTATVSDVGEVTFVATAEPGDPALVNFTENSTFTGVAGNGADGPIGVLVTDAFGNPLEAVGITWAVVQGGGSIRQTGATDAQGRDAVVPVLGPGYGLNLYSATAAGMADTIDVVGFAGAADPTGDTFDDGSSTSVDHDVNFFGGANVNDVLILYQRFQQQPTPPSLSGSDPSTSMWAIIDFDLDQDTTTGYLASRRCNEVDSLAFGSDGFIILDQRILPAIGAEAPPGAVYVGRVDSLDSADRCAAGFFGDVAVSVPVFRDNAVTVAVDRAFFNDDGVMDYTVAVVSGVTNNLTDLVPDGAAGTLDLSVPAASAVPLGLAASEVAGFRVIARFRVTPGMPIMDYFRSRRMSRRP